MVGNQMRIKRLKEGFLLRVQEEATQLSHSDICSRLSDALRDIGNDNGEYYYIRDIFGDDQSGDVVFSCGGNLMQAPYEFSQANGKQIAAIDMDKAIDVMPRTTYEPEADDEDHYASMEEAFVKAKLYKSLPLYERFISKSERDAADSGDFAGKGKSFPILQKGDVMAAVRSMGRAGSDNYDTGTLKRNIIRIAKKKGWSSALPKAWQNGSGDSKESTAAGSRQLPGEVHLTESAAAVLEEIKLSESAAVKTVPIKVIAPGPGSSAFYPKEVLQRDGPNVFKSGTHVYVNHPTAAEEASRPEGDANNLAGVLMKDAVWHESFMHKGRDMGPGLYSEVKPFSDHAQLFNEKGEFLGMSIRASGKAESGQKKNGLPVLTHLTSAESVDVVTKAGAGGMILSESARPAASQGEDMDLKEVQKLIDEKTGPLRERALRGDAMVFGSRALADMSLAENAKQMVIENVMGRGIPTHDDGSLHEKKFGEALEAEARRVGAVVGSGGARVFGMGTGEPTKKELKEAKAQKKLAKEARREARGIFEELGLSEDAAKFAAVGRAS